MTLDERFARLGQKVDSAKAAVELYIREGRESDVRPHPLDLRLDELAIRVQNLVQMLGNLERPK